jgi:hypothetical protein
MKNPCKCKCFAYESAYLLIFPIVYYINTPYNGGVKDDKGEN